MTKKFRVQLEDTGTPEGNLKRGKEIFTAILTRLDCVGVNEKISIYEKRVANPSDDPITVEYNNWALEQLKIKRKQYKN
ncbi:MAG: hypothetical protein ACRC4L_00190 [Mycoplasma sp.]